MKKMKEICQNFYVLVNASAGGNRDNVAKIQMLISKLENDGLKVGYHKNIFSNISLKSWSFLDEQYEESRLYKGLIVLGGDGTKTYILNRLISDGESKPFIGVASGTMNVGIINAFNIDEVPNDILLNEHGVDAILANDGIKDEYSFIDSVVGNTFVSTKNGIVTQVSVEKFMETGEQIRLVPQSVGSEVTSVKINIGNGKEVKYLPPIPKILTLAVAPISKEFRARVLSGGANPSTCIGMRGGLVVSDFPLIWADVTKGELIGASPITSSFFPLDYEDEVVVSNITDGFLISDGNVVRRIETISFKVVEDVYKVYA